MNYEIIWSRDIEKDFRKLKIKEEEFLKLKGKLVNLSKNPYEETQGVESLPNTIRKLKFGKYRLFMYMDTIGQNIDCLSIKQRKSSYEKHKLKHLLTQIKNFQ